MRYPFYRRVSGSRGESRRARKISPPPGFVPPIVQPLLIRDTGYAPSAACIETKYSLF